MADADQDDQALARALHAQGAAGVDPLREALAEARRRRARGTPSTLAHVVVEQGLVEPAVVEAAGSPPMLTPPGTWAGRPHETGARAGPAGTWAGRPGEGGAGAFPAQVGPWRVVRELAKGGMGAVYEVEHVETGGRYALKTVLGAGLADVDALARFRREAELGARLDHPNLARVHSADVDARPPWLVQTLLEGGSLEARLKQQGALPWEQAAAIGAKVARALEHAHARGVLHRDLKPANVMFDGAGEPRVVDFGVARSLREGTARLTATGEVLGSPAWMAPEQALGEKEVGAPADVHAVGALLFAVLTGEPPFGGRTALEVLEQVISSPAPAPSSRRAGVPAQLDAVVLRCMAKAPDQRFPSAGAVAEALEACATPEAVAPPARSLVPLLAAGAAASLLLGGAAIAVAARRGGSSSTEAPPPATTGVPPPRATEAPRPAGLLAEGWGPSLAEATGLTIRWGDTKSESKTAAGAGLVFRVTGRSAPDGEGWAGLDLTVDRVEFRLGRVDQSTGDPLAVLQSEDPEGASFLRGLKGRTTRLEVQVATGRVRGLAGLPSPPPRVFQTADNRPAFRAMLASFHPGALVDYARSAMHLFPDGPRAADGWRLQTEVWPDEKWGLTVERRVRAARQRLGVLDKGASGQLRSPDPLRFPPGMIQERVPIDAIAGEALHDGRRLHEASVTIDCQLPDGPQKTTLWVLLTYP